MHRARVQDSGPGHRPDGDVLDGGGGGEGRESTVGSRDVSLAEEGEVPAPDQAQFWRPLCLGADAPGMGSDRAPWIQSPWVRATVGGASCPPSGLSYRETKAWQ